MNNFIKSNDINNLKQEELIRYSAKLCKAAVSNARIDRASIHAVNKQRDTVTNNSVILILMVLVTVGGLITTLLSITSPIIILAGFIGWVVLSFLVNDAVAKLKIHVIALQHNLLETLQKQRKDVF